MSRLAVGNGDRASIPHGYENVAAKPNTAANAKSDVEGNRQGAIPALSVSEALIRVEGASSKTWRSMTKELAVAAHSASVAPMDF